MTNQQKPSKILNISLWVAQVLLALVFIWGGYMKLFTPVSQLAKMWPWVAQIPLAALKFTGIIDLLGGFGLTLPALFKMSSKLTPLAGAGIIVLMICACIFHISRGEASVIGANIVFALIAAFIVWGRFIKVPVAAVK